MEKKLKQESINIVKVVLFGPESTGKTTLASQLAFHYNTVWAPEYAREYLQEKWNTKRQVCEQEDLIPIAIGQIKLENQLAKKADRLLICDTDLLETKVYSEEYYGGYVDPLLDKAAKKNRYDLYLLTNIDTPWEVDDLRDRPDQREEMFNAFEKSLKDHNKNYIVLSGNKVKRFTDARVAIDTILKKKKNLYYYTKSKNILTSKKSYLRKFFNFDN